MKRYYLLLFVLFCSTVLWAQDIKVTGKVIDGSGLELPGVNIIEKGTSNGAVSKVGGTYEVTVSGTDATLVFSFIGFTSQEIVVGNQTTIDITLNEDAIGLEEVVAIGYGTQKKSDLTGSVEVIKADKIRRQPVIQTSSALQGTVPGLTVLQSSGQPGADGATLRIRGVGSINASSSPLVLIDGVEGDINGVDPADIENISVLKDAGASAIYGSRASNGVILVTTKRGQKGKLTGTYNGYMGFQTPTNQPEYLNSLGYYQLIGDDAMVEAYKNNPNDPDNYPDVDWADEMFSESGAIQYHNLSVSGGSEFASVQASLSYQDQDGNIPNFNYNRYQGRINTDFNFGKLLRISLDANYRKSERTSPNSGAQLRDTYRQLPAYAMRYTNGNWNNPLTGGNSVAYVRLGGVGVNNGDYFRARMKVELEPVKDLKLTAIYTPEISKNFNSSWAPQFELYDSSDSTDPVIRSFGSSNEARLGKSYAQSHTDNFSATANYIKTVGKHNVALLAGYESIYWQYENFGASRYGYILPDFPIMNNGNADNDNTSGTEDHYGLVSYFGRLNYSFDNRYLLTANIRRDGSSRFAEDSRWGVFPSFSAGWNLHNESFFPETNWLTRIKLRGSWGQLGNQSINSSFPYASLIAIGNSYYANDAIQQGAAQQVLANRAISWEKAESMNIGVDFGLFNNALSGTIEYYDKQTKDLLGSQKIPYTTGLSSPIANVYSMKNSGIDFRLEYRGSVGDFKYTIEGNVASLKNELTDLNGLDELISGNSINRIGEPVWSIFGYETIGLFKDEAEVENSPNQFGTVLPGDIKYKDQLTVDTNEDGIPDEVDGVINSKDRVVLGNSFPSITYGFELYTEYKGFDLSAAFTGVGVREVYLREYLVWPLYNGGSAAQWMIDGAWTPDNLDARYPEVRKSTSSNNYRTNSTYVYDASYVRLRNLTVGYTLPKNLTAKVNLSNVRLYASGQNLLTFDKMPQGIDPTVPNGSNGGQYPLVKVYTFGLSASF